METIYHFDDYRDFLKHRYLHLKNENKKISIEYISRKIGCSSSFLKKIFSKKTYLGINNVDRMAKAFLLSTEEQEYLFFLILHSNKAIGEETRSYLKYILITLKDKRLHFLQFNREANELNSLKLVATTSDYLINLCLELSKIVNRPSTFNDLNSYIFDFLATDQQKKEAAIKAEKVMTQFGLENSTVHQSFSGPASVYSAANLKQTMLSSVQLTATVLDKIHELTPFTSFAGIYAVNKQDSVKILTILKDARTRIIDICQASQKPNRVISVQMFGYHLTKLLDSI